MELSFAMEAKSDDALCVYCIDSSAHPIDFAEVNAAYAATDVVAGVARVASSTAVAVGVAAQTAGSIPCNVVRVPVDDWGANLTPWAAPGIYRGEDDFGGGAAKTLEALVQDAIPDFEAKYGLAPSNRAIMGYSLGGLFALYSFMSCDKFSMMASLSGSMWYDGLLPWIEGALEENPGLVEGRRACFTLGKKEKRAASSLLKSVQDRTEQVIGLLSDAGCSTSYDLVSGGHMNNVAERYALAFGRLLA